MTISFAEISNFRLHFNGRLKAFYVVNGEEKDERISLVYFKIKI